ncbi:MAG: hypothetical protein IPJ89_05705 [Candidatus Iainarchaeum archaeon]|uniref:Uncharacterized protein n=1 Tax=Candidatus Iainarchaeum sp. TaxID=3101447 RepID=A0A7T9DJU5_9ARCH|nr:MAG: hypothetical protein IPJ89_05705 [Candidatus Diapherotrites archaeon]
MAFSFRRFTRTPAGGSATVQPDACHVFMNHLRRESTTTGNRQGMGKALREIYRIAGKQPLFERLLNRNPTIRVGNGTITKAQLKTIEHMLAREGFETTLMHISTPHPMLADLFQDKEQYAEFVSQISEKKWQQVLAPFAVHPNQQLRAMALLVFLQNARMK